ncbi:ATP-binding protein [Streptomyces canus]|uniref:ATP-binding protein n=1 Tax=Streptomyces canus TaxID=58343 RepID=UPI0027883FCF|nr:ATP-binding protein [Streptomyces canus]MDQ0765474.1 anti-sigma regulatory factor (Ser/Thr protein kinase) [Streptomyces canus]
MTPTAPPGRPAAPAPLNRLLRLRTKAAALAALRLASRRSGPARETVSWPLERATRAGARARELTRDQLAVWHLHEHTDTAELLVSELVTNALTHTQGPIRLSISRTAGHRTLRCAVADACPTRPRQRRAHTDEEHGRGLHLLDQLSARWGTQRTAAGKTVWFDLRAPARPRPLPATGEPANTGGRNSGIRS